MNTCKAIYNIFYISRFHIDIYYCIKLKLEIRNHHNSFYTIKTNISQYIYSNLLKAKVYLTI